MRPLRRAVAVLAVLSLCAQATGAAEIAGLMGPAAARAVLLPPPGRAAPAPAAPRPAAVPAGPGWLESAAVVGAWTRDLLAAALSSRVSPAPAAYPATEPYGERVPPPHAVVKRPPAAEPPVDRILIAGGTGVIGAYGELASWADMPERSPVPYQERFTGFWSRGEGISVRVDYLAPWGINRADESGFTLLFPGRLPRRIDAREPVPPLLRREHPVYFRGDEVEVELTLRNDTARTLEDVVVSWRQEGLMLDGSSGPALSSRRFEAPLRLAPGESKTVRWSMLMSGLGLADVNFEQTAVRVTALGEDGAPKTLLDAHQAGIVDPPSP